MMSRTRVCLKHTAGSSGNMGAAIKPKQKCRHRAIGEACKSSLIVASSSCVLVLFFSLKIISYQLFIRFLRLFDDIYH